jgi:tRNA A-37 threonylcarbamoyl transferase component Bud32
MLAGRYAVGEMIGEGSFAETFVATDVMLNRRVAIKILRPELSAHPEYVQRFAREAQAAAAVRHSNVIDVFDFGKDGNLTFLVMEWVSGPCLKRFIHRRRLDVSQALAITGEILNGLAAIHAAGIVHRDIKPHNILLSSGTPKVTDFGIARFNGAASATRTGVALGTASYMAPEQARGEAVTPAADIYATGVMLYEMITGRLPFSGNDPIQVLYQHVHERPPRPRLLNPHIPPYVEEMILRAMSKHPEDRFQSAEEMLDAIDRALIHVDEHATQFIMAPAFGATAAGALSRGIQRTAPLVAIAAFAAILVAMAGIALTFNGAQSGNGAPTEPGIAEAPFATLARQPVERDRQDNTALPPATTSERDADTLPAATEEEDPETSSPATEVEVGQQSFVGEAVAIVVPVSNDPESNHEEEVVTSQAEPPSPPAMPSGGEQQTQVQDASEGNGATHGQRATASGHHNAAPHGGVPPGQDRNASGNGSSSANFAAAPGGGNQQGNNRGGRGR